MYQYLGKVAWVLIFFISAKQQRYHVRYAYNGGCATYRQNYPRSLGGIVRTGSYSRCLALCKRNSNCGWFEYCFGSNCKGNCLLNPKSLPVCKGNHYPTVKCYKLTRYWMRMFVWYTSASVFTYLQNDRFEVTKK